MIRHQLRNYHLKRNRLGGYFRFLCMFTLAFYAGKFAVPQLNLRNDEAAYLEEAKAAWARIRRAEPPELDRYEPGSIDYWGVIARVGYTEMKKVVDSPGAVTALTFFVDQFGADGADDDMRWIMPVRLLNLAPDQRPAIPESNVAVRCKFAELLVKRFLAEPALLERYYHYVIWNGRFFSDLGFPVHLGTLHREMNKANAGEGLYWWHAHNFLLMAHATNRDDLLTDVDASDLKKTFQDWMEWLKQNGMYLRPSKNDFTWELDKGEKERLEGYVPFVLSQKLPKLRQQPANPFPDWDFKPAPTPEEFLGIE